MSKIKKIKRSALKALLFFKLISKFIPRKVSGVPSTLSRDTDAGSETAVAAVRNVVDNRTDVVDKTRSERIRRKNATHPIPMISTTSIII